MKIKALTKLTIFPIAAALAWLGRAALLNYSGSFNTWYHSLGQSERIAFVSTAVLAVIGLLPVLRSLYRNRKKQSRDPFPYRILSSADKLYSELGIPGDRLQTYIERKQIVEAWGISLIPNSNKLLLFGNPGVGKSREAIELIKRLSRADKPKIVYRQGEALRPTESSPDLANRVVLYIDDVKLELATKIEQSEEDFSDERVGKELQATVRFFEKEYPSLIVILTMPKLQFEALKLARPRFVDEFQVIEIAEMEQEERHKCASEQAKKLGPKAADPRAFDVLAANEIQPLLCIYDFFNTLRDQGKNEFSLQDVQSYCDVWKAGRKNAFESNLRQHQPNSVLVLNAVSCLTDFEIEAKELIVRHLFMRMNPRVSMFTRKRRQFDRALKYLSKRCLTISNNDVVKIGGHPFSSRNAKDSSRRKDLVMLVDVARDLHSHSFFRRGEVDVADAVEFLNKLTKRLNNNRLRRDALEVAQLARSLAPNDTRALFQVGMTLLGMGQKRDAEVWFRRALSAGPEPKYASHISHKLAKLCLKDGRRDEALALLDRSYTADPNDLLTLALKLDTLRESDIFSKSAIGTYRMIQEGVERADGELSNRLSAEFACVRFCVEYKEQKRKPARPLLRLTRRIRPIIDAAPVEARKRAVLAHRLAVLCFDQAKVDEKNKGLYLSESQLCLEHAILIDPLYVLKWAQVQNFQIDWKVVADSDYWSEATRVLDMYHQALRSGEDRFSKLHNAKVHHAAGCFLWHVEMEAYKRQLEKPEGYVSAKDEFERSIEIEHEFEGTVSQDMREHLTLAYFSLGDYLMTVGGRDAEQRLKARQCISRSFKLTRPGKTGFDFTSENSYVETYVGQLFLEAKELAIAKTHLRNAVEKPIKNEKAWRLLGDIAENERDWNGALSYFEAGADLKKSAHSYSNIRNKRQIFVNAGLLENDLGANLRLSRKAYALDPEGEHHINNILDCAYDERRLAAANGDKEGFARAKDLLVKASLRIKLTRDLFKVSSVLWDAGECAEAYRGAVDEDSMRLYLDSVKLQVSVDRLYRLVRKLERMLPEQAVHWFMTAVSEGIRGDYIPLELANYCTNHDGELSEDTLKTLRSWTDENPRTTGHAELARVIKRQMAMRSIPGVSSLTQ
jgi:tetratricopeptide (TPR) repeat protein